MYYTKLVYGARRENRGMVTVYGAAGERKFPCRSTAKAVKAYVKQVHLEAQIRKVWEKLENDGKGVTV